MKSGAKSSRGRRRFLQSAFILAVSSSFLKACKSHVNKIFLRLTGTDHVLAHRLRFPDFPTPSSSISTPILILGGGVAGLAAAYRLTQQGHTDFLLVDLEAELGGNARQGRNAHSSYPLGAHYLPIPNQSNQALIQFLEDAGVITGRDAQGEPIYDPEQLTFAPQSRLFIRNTWQEGLLPRYGLAQAELDEIDRFLKQMSDFQQQRGDDGRFVFDIPLQFASKKTPLHDLDRYTMFEWMHERGYRGKHLINYVNYCCRDDYGLGVRSVSAFAGIHYFASRKHDLKQYADVVLTWQEGNARLISHLKKHSQGRVLNRQLAYKIDAKTAAVEVAVYDDVSKRSTLIKADQVINCCPQFVNQYLLPDRSRWTKDFAYVPWVVATIVLKKFPFADGAPLAWDNVIEGANGLGYVYAQHQSVGQFSSPFVISYYHSMDGLDCKKSRQELFERTDEQWKDFIVKDLAIAHFGIEQEIESIEIFRHGHGMICPVPGFLFSKARQTLGRPIDGRIFFAHTDLSGISIFEEGFYQGLTAADQLLAARSAR